MSGFYNRTLLRFLGVHTPQPFIDLDSAIDHFYRDVSTVTLSIEVKHGENICRRYADLHLYDKNLREALKHPDAFNGALLAGSYLVSYCSSAKSLLDSVSIALNEVKEMNLPNKKQDFSRKDFWEKFKKSDSQCCKRYEPLKNWFDEVVHWRDSAVHRITPLIIVHSAGPLEDKSRDELQIKIIPSPDVGLSDLLVKKENLKWKNPTFLSNEWNPHIEKLIHLICEDLCSKLS